MMFRPFPFSSAQDIYDAIVEHFRTDGMALSTDRNYDNGPLDLLYRDEHGSRSALGFLMTEDVFRVLRQKKLYDLYYAGKGWGGEPIEGLFAIDRRLEEWACQFQGLPKGFLRDFEGVSNDLYFKASGLIDAGERHFQYLAEKHGLVYSGPESARAQEMDQWLRWWKSERDDITRKDALDRHARHVQYFIDQLSPYEISLLTVEDKIRFGFGGCE